MEIAIKCSIGKLHLPAAPEIYVPQARVLHLLAELPLSEQAALHLSALPLHHKDPFDRQLVAQAHVHNLTMISSDPLLHLYPINLL